MTTATEQANRSAMDPMRLVVVFYLMFGIVLALFLDHVLEMIWAGAGFRNPEIVEGLGWKVTTVLGVVMALGIGLGAYFHPKTKTLSLEVASELMKVTWPSWAETRVSTVAVVVASAVSSIILFLFDWFSYHVMVDWLPHLWGKL
jgi:preprotein translocase subunit SecE